jgi:hypothetical protein
MATTGWPRTTAFGRLRLVGLGRKTDIAPQDAADGEEANVEFEDRSLIQSTKCTKKSSTSLS